MTVAPECKIPCLNISLSKLYLFVRILGVFLFFGYMGWQLWRLIVGYLNPNVSFSFPVELPYPVPHYLLCPTDSNSHIIPVYLSNSTNGPLPQEFKFDFSSGYNSCIMSFRQNTDQPNILTPSRSLCEYVRISLFNGSSNCVYVHPHSTFSHLSSTLDEFQLSWFTMDTSDDLSSAMTLNLYIFTDAIPEKVTPLFATMASIEDNITQLLNVPNSTEQIARSCSLQSSLWYYQSLAGQRIEKWIKGNYYTDLSEFSSVGRTSSWIHMTEYVRLSGRSDRNYSIDSFNYVPLSPYLNRLSNATISRLLGISNFSWYSALWNPSEASKNFGELAYGSLQISLISTFTDRQTEIPQLSYVDFLGLVGGIVGTLSAVIGVLNGPGVYSEHGIIYKLFYASSAGDGKGKSSESNSSESLSSRFEDSSAHMQTHDEDTRRSAVINEKDSHYVAFKPLTES